MTQSRLLAQPRRLSDAMAKSKGKAQTSSVVPPKVEEPAGNDAIVEFAPPESAEVEKAATAGVQELDELEETNDVLDKFEGEDKEEKITDDLHDSGEGDEKGDDEVDEGEGAEVEGDEGNEDVEEEEEFEEVEVENEEEEENENADEKEDQQETKENRKVESIAIDVVPQGAKVGRDNTKEGKGSGKGENVPTKKAKNMRKSKKEAVGDVNKQSDAGTSAVKKKDVKKLGSMGLIFMCNKKTKKDCFQYNIFGLPESKKELVAKIYKGMRLFLFDVDLKLMYGIYKAAGPGGYNIEPKAFKSAYPSQVRFRVLNDCLPLPEEKFKSAIKENYYGRNKFDCQLSSEQVNNLCKLFQSTTKLSKKVMSKDVKRAEVKRAEPEPTSSARARKRSRHNEPASYSRDRKRTHRDEPPASYSRDRKRTRRDEPPASSIHDRKRSHRREIERREQIVPRSRDLYPPRRREAYDSPPPQPLPRSPPPLSYSYDRPVEDYYYRRDPQQLEPRDRRVLDLERRPLELRPLELRPLEPPEYRDPYALYRERLPYREPLYPPSSVYAPPPPAAASSLHSSFAPPHLYYRY